MLCCHSAGVLAGALEERRGGFQRDGEARNSQLVVGEGLRRGVGAIGGARSGTVPVHRLGDDEHRRRTVPLRVHRLGPGVGVQREARSVEHGPRVVFLRLVVEDEHRLALRVEPGVVVVAEFRRRDAEAREDDFQLDVDRPCRIREEDGGGPERRLAIAPADNDGGALAVEADGNQVEALEEALPVRRSKPGLLHLGGEEPGGGIGPSAQRHPALERRRGQELDVGAHPVAARRDLLGRDRGEGEQACGGDQVLHLGLILHDSPTVWRGVSGSSGSSSSEDSRPRTRYRLRGRRGVRRPPPGRPVLPSAPEPPRG